jgi:hypothetical protein
MDSFSKVLPQISSANLPRVCQSLDRTIRVGQGIYQSQRARQKNHHAAVRALAYQWIRIIFRCGKDGTPYNEQVYLESQRRRGALLGPALAAATSAGWQQVAGFQKFSRRPD